MRIGWNRGYGIAAVLLAFGLGAAQARTWTDSTGQQHLDADLVDVDSQGMVILNQGRPTDIKIELKHFSKPDQQYIQAELQRRRTALQAELSAKPGAVLYDRPRKLADLANPSIAESSGIACSRNHQGVFWSHNDSGDDARLYAFDVKGRDLGSCLLAGVQAFDWEDIASFSMDGKNYLLVGDIGNNGLNADVQILYLIEEPPLDPRSGVKVKQVPVAQTINIAHEDAPRNCEALAVDPTTRTILLVSKEKKPPCYVYALPWPKSDPKKVFTARKIATLKLPIVTAMDISPDGRRAVVGTYRNGYEFSRAASEGWAAALSRKPVEIELPERVQGEAICYGSDGKTLYLTSEKRPTPLWEVPVKK